MVRLDELVRRGKEILAFAQDAVGAYQETHSGPAIQDDLFGQFRGAALAFLDRAFGSQSPYVTEFRDHVKNRWLDDVNHGIGIMTAAISDLEGGWIETTRGLVSAEVFADFLEMSEHLVDEHYKRAA